MTPASTAERIDLFMTVVLTDLYLDLIYFAIAGLEDPVRSARAVMAATIFSVGEKWIGEKKAISFSSVKKSVLFDMVGFKKRENNKNTPERSKHDKKSHTITSKFLA